MKQFLSVLSDSMLVCCAMAAIIIVVSAGGSVQSAVPQMTTYQGRLLDAADQPMEGSFTLTFSIYDSPTGGSPLWTEDHIDVSVVSGLFSVELGSTVPMSADVFAGGSTGTSTRYLEVQLAGQAPLVPRLILASVPSALTSSRVSGDLETSPGSLTVTDGTGTGSASVLALQPYGGHLIVHNERSSGTMQTSLIGSEIHLIDDRDLLGLREYSASATADSASSKLGADDDGDGVAERYIWQKVDNSDLDVQMVVDVDHDGAPDVGTTVNAIESRDVLKTFFERGDKPTQSQFVVTVDETGARHAINTKGTGATNHRTLTTSTDENAASAVFEADFDGDGVPEGVLAQRCTSDSVVEESSAGDGSSSSVHNVRTRVNDLENRLQHFGILARTMVTSSCNDAGASHQLSDDEDGDGVPEESLALSVGLGVTAVKGTFTPPGSLHPGSLNESSTSATESLSLLATDLDDDGVPENEASLHVTPTTSSVAIKTKGTGADKDRSSIISTTGLDSATIVGRHDSDDDGVPESELSCTTGDKFAQVRGFSVEISGASRYSFESSCDSTMTQSSLTGSSSGVVGPPASVTFTVDAAGPSVKLTNDGSVIHVMNGDGTVMRNSLGGVAAQISTSGEAYFGAKVGIGVITPTAALEVAGGAYCDGTDWVNASDANSKENFAPVDGRELLDQISDLEITKWNYKGEVATEHIGPTAQDFQETFGVGSDGKSISTIDPSGIALAAIKELTKQNQELKAQSRELRQQNVALKQQLDELTGKVNELINHK